MSEEKREPVVHEASAVCRPPRKLRLRQPAAGLPGKRQSVLNRMKKYYLDNFVEDDVNGSDFDLALFRAFEKLASAYGMGGIFTENDIPREGWVQYQKIISNV